MSGNEVRQMDEAITSKALQGLPVKFVTAMRTLFDVMDDKKTGFISLADIESRWCTDKEEVGSVPPGVIDSLKKVTPASGELSFERFCAGLKICLLRNKADKGRRDSSSHSNETVSESEDHQSVRLNRLKQQRTLCNPSPALSLPPQLESAGGPPKPPRNGYFDRRLGDGVAVSDGEIENKSRTHNFGNKSGNNDGKSAQKSANNRLQPDQQEVQQRKQPKRRESHSRRHTLQSGIDYGLLKRMKAVEEERDALLKGLQTVEKAEQWYRDQLDLVQDKIKTLARTGGNRPDNEITREKVVFQIARIQEVNQHLNCLMTADMTFPLGMNLALGGRAALPLNGRDQKELERQILRLKDQNKLLTEEVGKKSNAITVLDQEKGALIRELFQARARVRQAESEVQEATFISSI